MDWSFDEIRDFIPKSIPLPYSREEKNGYRSLLTGRDELNYIMMNGSGSYILPLTFVVTLPLSEQDGQDSNES